MPWYRMPHDLQERAAREAERAKPRSRAQELVLELVRAERAAAEPLFAGEWCNLNFGSRGNRAAAPPCRVCGWISERLCDYKVGGRDCDAPLCESCAWSPAPGKDICPAHVGAVKAWLAARTNSTDGEGP